MRSLEHGQPPCWWSPCHSRDSVEPEIRHPSWLTDAEAETLCKPAAVAMETKTPSTGKDNLLLTSPRELLFFVYIPQKIICHNFICQC